MSFSQGVNRQINQCDSVWKMLYIILELEKTKRGSKRGLWGGLKKKWFEDWVILGPAENMRTCWEDFTGGEASMSHRMWQKRHVWEMLGCPVNQRVGNMGRLLRNGSRQAEWGQIMNVLGCRRLVFVQKTWETLHLFYNYFFLSWKRDKLIIEILKQF